MENLLKNYEETIIKIEQRIKELRIKKLEERNLEKLHNLEWRIDILVQERLEMMKSCAEMREFLAPKEPSLYEIFQRVSGDY